MVILKLFDNYSIRSWKMTDVESISNYANNHNIWINLRDAFPHPYTRTDAQTFIAKSLSREQETSFTVADDSEAIGSIGFVIQKDVHKNSAELGYWLAESYWNRGIMTAAVKVITKYAFDTFGLTRMYAEPYANNRASVRVLEKGAYVFEGRLVSSAIKNGQLLDQLIFARINSSTIINDR